MPEYKQWYIIGNCYDIKDDLKAMGCRWNPAPIKKWKTPTLETGELIFNRIESLAAAVDCSLRLCDEYLSPEAKKIQGILNGK